MSETGYRSYSLSAVGELVVAQRAIQNALDKAHSPDNQDGPYARHFMDPDIINHSSTEAVAAETGRKLERSELFAAYTEEDKLEALRYTGRLIQSSQKPEWTVEGRTTAAYKLPDIERRVPAQTSDLGILTGYGAIDLVGGNLGSFSSHGFGSMLRFAQFLAACSVDRLSKSQAVAREASYKKRIGYSVDRLVVVSADMQGGLNISASEQYPFGAKDILGVRQKFAPDRVDEVKLHARDNSEPGMLTVLMWWASRIKLPEKVQRRYFANAVYEALRIKDKAEEFPAEIYDKGLDAHSELGEIEILLAEEQAGVFCESRVRDIGYVALGALGVTGTEAKLRSYLRRSDDSLLMRTDHGTEPLEDDQIPHIVFPPDELPMLARALVEQTKKGLGRTSLKTMAGMIAYRFSPEFREFVRSPEFPERDNRAGELLTEFYSSY